MMDMFGFREICRETILGFVFWSIFEALVPMIWFYPLNAMEVSGYEVFLLAVLSPILMGSKWVRNIFHNRSGLGLFRIFSVASLASFQAPDTLTRLAVLAIGNFFNMLVLTGSLWNTSGHQRYLTCWGLIIGKFALLTTRIWYTTFSPVWHDDMSNSFVICLGLMATVDKILSGGDAVTISKPQNPTSQLRDQSHDKDPVRWGRIAVGFGSLLFLLQWVFGEVSVVARWIDASHPNTGPMPYPSGLLVLCALFLGLLSSFYIHKMPRFWWWTVGLCSLLCLNYLAHIPAFCGGLILAVFTPSIWPTMMERLYQCPPGRTMTLVSLTWMIEILYEIWTVAFNFVPGGVFTREHTDYLIIFVMFGLLLGLLAVRQRECRFTESKDKRANIVKAMLMLLLLGAGGYAWRYPKQKFVHPPKLQPKADFTAGVWAFHFGYDNMGWPSVIPSSEFIKDAGVDVIGLLETDASKPFLGNNDLVMWLSERLGMYMDFGVPTRDHCWGVAFLSKYPITQSSHHHLPSPHGELAPAIVATVNMTGNLVDFVVTHMGNDWDTLDRELQAKALSKLLRETKNPVVFLGYLTSKPGSRDYKRLLTGGNVKDIDDTDRKRFCEYIMYRGLIRLGYARVSHGGLSDTELQMARFRIPGNAKGFTDNNRITTYYKDIEACTRFNPAFGSYAMGHNWMMNHRFHMNTPKYFLSKK